MEVVGLVGSIIAIVDATKKTCNFAISVYKADEQRLAASQRLHCLDDVSKTVEWLKREDPNGDWTKDLDPDDKTSPVYGLKIVDKQINDLLKFNNGKVALKLRLSNWKWHESKKGLDPLFNEIQRHGLDILKIMVRAEAAINKKYHLSTTSNIINDNAITRSVIKDEGEHGRRLLEANTAQLLAMAVGVNTLSAEQEIVYRKNVVQWLSKLEFKSRHQAILANVKASQGTSIGQWFFDEDAFKVWVEGKLKVLKGLGDAGTGKTVLSSLIVEELSRRSPHTPTLYIFLEKAESHRQTPDELRGSLLRQLIQFDNESGPSQGVRETYDKARITDATPDAKEITDLLKAYIETHTRVYVIVDGLDEASYDARIFLEEELEEIHPRKMSIMTMSRRTAATEALYSQKCNICDSRCARYFKCLDCELCRQCTQELRDGVSLCFDCYDGGRRCPHGLTHEFQETTAGKFEIDIETPADDIRIYVQNSIKADMPKPTIKTESRNVGKNALARACSLHPEIFEEIQTFVAAKANGKFLLAREYVKSFKKKTNLADIRLLLRTNGKDALDLLYQEDIGDILGNKEWGELATQVFSIIYHAKRNLTLLEFQQALAAKMRATRHDPDAITHEDDILRATAGIIRIERPSGDIQVDVFVRFDHLTRREYFDSSWQDWFVTGQVDIANICLTFLNFEDFKKAYPSDEDSKAKEQELPFISYAVQFWGDHVRDLRESSEEIMNEAVTYMQDSSRRAAFIQAAWLANTRHKDKWDVRHSISPLHICGWFGLDHLIQVLDCSEVGIDAEEPTHHQTPLMYASRRGHVRTVECFLKLGADVNKQSCKGRTPLFEALLRLQKDQLDQDPKQGKKIPRKNVNSETDIQKSVKIVKLLLSSKKVNLNIRNAELRQRNVLMTSIEYKQVTIALDILSHEYLDVNMADSEGTTALCISACLGLTRVVTRLLEIPSLDLELFDNDGHQTALMFAARSSPTPDVIKLLLKKGADPNKPDARVRLPIFMSLLAASPKIFLAFVTGASQHIDRASESKPYIDLTSVDEDGRTLCHWAAQAGNMDAIDTLEANDLSIDFQDNLGMRPLHDACRSGKVGTATQLLSMNADRSAKDKLGRTPATIALQYGHFDLLKILKIEGEAEMRPVDLPAWSLSTTRDFDTLARMISEDPLCLNITEPGTGRSALHCIMLENFRDEGVNNVQMKIMRLLLVEGKMDPDEPDRYGQTPLHYTAGYGNLQATRLLIDHKVRPDTIDNFGFTPLVIAYKNRGVGQNVAVATALIEADATIDKNRMNLDDLLIAAVKLGSPTAAAYLLKEGADRMATDSDGRTAEFIAEKTKNTALVKLMRDHSSKRIKDLTRGMSSENVVSELREVIEEPAALRDAAKHKEVMFSGISARSFIHTPFSTGKFDLGQGVENKVKADVGTKLMPHLEPRAKREDEVERILGNIPPPSSVHARNKIGEPVRAA